MVQTRLVEQFKNHWRCRQLLSWSSSYRFSFQFAIIRKKIDEIATGRESLASVLVLEGFGINCGDKFRRLKNSIPDLGKRKTFTMHLLVHPLPIIGGHLTPEWADDWTAAARSHLAAIFERQSFHHSIEKPAGKQVSCTSCICWFWLPDSWNSNNLAFERN